MRTTLIQASQEDIVNHSIESVLPGVHTKLSTIHNDVIMGTKKSQQAIKEVRDNVISEINRRDMKWAAALRTLGEQFESQSVQYTARRGGHAVMTNNNSTPAILTQDDENVGDDVDMSEDAPSPTYNMKMRYNEIYEIWDEWSMIIEDFENKGKSWRSHFSAAEKQHFSRFKQVIKGILTIADSKGTVQDAMNKLASIYKDKCKPSLSKMADWMKSNRHVQKKGSRNRNSQ